MYEHLPKVKQQYESLPYPPRDPAHETRRLERTWLDDLAMINHYGFGGRQEFNKGFRILVAGGGTGDATIFLAEQLRHTDAQIVHLDFSSASIAIARERAAIRKLENIEFICESLLKLPQLNLSPFDYINCVGVLHHLDDPEAGFRAIESVRKPDGVFGLMLYATYGRTGVYQLQSLLRIANRDADTDDERIANTRHILAALPPTNWFKRGEDLMFDHRTSDAGLYDLLLHTQDRSYTVPEIYAWIADQYKLHLNFSDVQRGRAPYFPHLVIQQKVLPLAESTRELPLRSQHEMAELMSGTLTMHTFYASPSVQSTAHYGDPDMVPFFYHEPMNGEQMAAVFHTNQGRPFVLNHAHSGVSATVTPGKYSRNILRHIDGHRSFGEIFEQIRRTHAPAAQLPSDAQLFEDFRDSYEILNTVERLLLRHKNVPAFRV